MIPTDTIDKLEAVWRSTSALGDAARRTRLEAADRSARLDGAGQPRPPDRHRAHVARPARPPRPPSVMGNHVKNPIGQFNEAEVEARRGRTGDEVLQEWNELVELRLATLRNADDAHFAKEMMTPTGPGTMADFLHIRVLDCWVHEQDMRRAVGRAGHLGGPSAEHTIDRLLRTLPIVVGKRAATPEGGAVIVDITGAVDRHVVCEVTGGRAAIVRAATNEPLATSSSRSGDVRGAGHRSAHRPRRSPSESSSTGDQSLGQRVVDNLNMMI